MKYLKIFLAISFMAIALTGCRNDDLDPNSIFDTTSPERNEFDEWLLENYTKPYNINVIYRYIDRETSAGYNVIPAEESKARTFAILTRYMWLEAYKQALGEDFLKTNSPRVLQFIGSPQPNGTDGTWTVGYAQGGLKMTLCGVNNIDPDNIKIDTESIFQGGFDPTGATANDLNKFFHTMHHEFCHILTQKKNYPTDFNTVSAGTYIPSDWHNKSDADMVPEGFVTAYASMETNEDFAESYSYYVTHSQTSWEALLTRAKDGATKITQKMDIVKQYFHDSWDLDLDTLRSIVLSRADDIRQGKVDIKNLDTNKEGAR
ncbi:MAG: putative zinc-binding metallopeptidase [Prevotellaceae bacterium]|nr:putative zinc-binding metallopeptidase [Prevotellaceae bacterium]